MSSSGVTVSVAVATRNRPDQIGPCLESICQNSADYLELVVIDQSDDDGSEKAAAHIPTTAKLRYVRTDTRGLSRARNLAVASTTGDVIAFTDDDCRVPGDWIRRLATVYEKEPRPDLVFGRVTIPKVGDGVAFGASFEPHQRHMQGVMPDVRSTWGIGANMSFRRSIFERIGPFDELLGPGAEFRAGDDVDFALRVLAAGGLITNAEEVTLHHLGVREGSEASKLVRGYLFATGAVYTKLMRLHTRGSAKLLTDTILMHVENSARNVVRGVRPTGLGQLIALTQGAVASLRFGIDPAQGIYRSRES